MHRMGFFILVFFLASSVRAVTVLSTDSGTSEANIKQGVSDGIFDSLAKHAGDWISQGMDKIGNWAVETLFQIYDKYIGTFLIYIPDLASPNTYSAIPGVGASAAVSVILNILKITSGTGLFILIVGFVIDTGQRSSGLWDRVVDSSSVIGFTAAFLCLFAWPSIHSFLTNAVTAMGYYVYNQNTLQTSGVLQGFLNIDLSTGSGAVQLAKFDFRGNFITAQGIVWNLIYLISLSLVVLGFYNAYSALSAGDSKRADQRFFQAVAGIILILGTPTLVHVFIAKGVDSIGNQPAPGAAFSPFSLQGLVQDNGTQYPQQQNSIPTNVGTAVNGIQSVPSTSRLALFAGGLVKCGVALWGLITCFAVIFAKFFQVLNLWVLFVLGPLFIGCLGHPATAPIFWGAARYFVKLLLYSVIWAVTLVGLYLIPNINWGVETIGVNSLLTALAVLAGLQLIANAQEFAGLFTTFSGANLKGEGINDFKRDTVAAVGGINAGRLMAFGAVRGATGETGQAVATAAGAAMGSIIPGVGTAGGAMAFQKMTKGMNVAAHLGSVGAKHTEESNGPIAGLLRKFSGKMISKNLDKDFKKNRDFSPKEMEKHRLLGNYAKRLGRSGEKEANRGTGGDKRDGHGDTA